MRHSTRPPTGMKSSCPSRWTWGPTPMTRMGHRSNHTPTLSTASCSCHRTSIRTVSRQAAAACSSCRLPAMDLPIQTIEVDGTGAYLRSLHFSDFATALGSVGETGESVDGFGKGLIVARMAARLGRPARPVRTMTSTSTVSRTSRSVRGTSCPVAGSTRRRR